MGVHINLVVLLKEWIERHGITGPVMTLGVQSVPYTAAELTRALGLAGEYSGEDGKVSAARLFAVMGLGATMALDVSDYEGADVQFDLNSDALPPELHRRFGLVFNGGTLEHLFHVPNALANVSRLVAGNGSIIHVLPLNNWVDHGFYQFSPTLMFDYYAAAGCEIRESVVAAFHPRREGGSCWEMMAAPPGLFGNGAPGTLDDRSYYHLVLVRAPDTVVDAPRPTQSLYESGRSNEFARPRWFSTFELRYGTRFERPSRMIVPLRRFEREVGRAWVCFVPELASWADTMDHPTRSRLVVLEDERPLGPAHAAHDSIREQGCGAYSHWGAGIHLSIPDGSDPNTNGRDYVAVVPGNEAW